MTSRESKEQYKTYIDELKIQKEKNLKKFRNAIKDLSEQDLEDIFLK